MSAEKRVYEETAPGRFRFLLDDRFFSTETINANEPIIFHYTRASGAAGILRSRQFWLSPVEFTNDELELRYAVNLVSSFASQLLREADTEFRNRFNRQLRSFRERSSFPDLFVASFSEAEDLLSQWRGYASPAGYALGFSLDGLRERANQQNLILGPVTYEHQEAEASLKPLVRALIEAHDGSLDPSKEADFRKIFTLFGSKFEPIYEQCLLIKHPGFKEEREWRIVTRPWQDYRAMKDVIERRGELMPVVRMSLYRGTTTVNERPLHDICLRTWRSSPGSASDRERRWKGISELVTQLDLRWTGGQNSSIPFRP